MKLKATLENLDGLDDAVKQFYTQKGDKFVLNIDGFDNHPEVEGLKKSLKVTRDEKKAAETKASELEDKYAGLPDDFTVDDFNRLKDSGGGDINQKLTEQKERLEAIANKVTTKLTQERDEARGKLNNLYVDNALTAAINEIGVATPFTDAVKALFKDRVKLNVEGDETIVTVDNMPVTDHLKAWAVTDKGKHYITAADNGGGGSGNPGGGGIAYDKMNLTELAGLAAKDQRAKAELDRRGKI